jgi:hypothetical protein
MENDIKKSDDKKKSGRPRRSRPKSSKPKTTGNYVRDHIPNNMGITIPGFLRYSAAEEGAFVPFGMVYGYYLPVGQNSNEYYPQQCNQFLNRIQVAMRSRGFRTTFTQAELRAYYNSVSELIQMQRYVAQMNGLLRVTGLASSPVLSLVASQSINGRLLNVHRMLTKTLQSVPYPRDWVNTYMNGFGSTNLSNNPNSGLRLFAPKRFEPVIGEVLNANTLADAIETAVGNFFGVDTNRELSTILQECHSVVGELGLIEESLLVFRNDVINNILNLPYWDGIQNDPVADDVTSVPMFFRRDLTVQGCLTFAPDNNIVTSPQGTVWVQNDGVESTATLIAFDNDGIAVNAMTDTNVFACFGAMWEASIALESGNAPSITRVTATFQGVADGVAEYMLNRIKVL